MNEYIYSCSSCGTVSKTLSLKKYKNATIGKKTLCDKCKSEAYKRMIFNLQKQWEENRQ